MRGYNNLQFSNNNYNRNCLKFSPKNAAGIALGVMFFLISAICVFAESGENPMSRKMAISLGPEWNMNSRENFAAGAALNFDYNLGSSFAIGLNITFSSNFSGIAVIEPAALFRWYFLGDNSGGWFVQAETGVYLIFEDQDITPMFLGGLRGGFRLPLGEMFFVEPFGRMGYPFMFGVGALAGVRF